MKVDHALPSLGDPQLLARNPGRRLTERRAWFDGADGAPLAGAVRIA